MPRRPRSPTAAATRPHVGRSSARAISQSAVVETGYASGSSTRIGEYASAGTATEAPAAASAYHFGTTIRASPYAGNTVAVIARTRMSFAAAHDAVVEPSHQTGASAYATSVASPYGSPRRAGSPVSAMERASCVSSSSSVKIVGTGRRDACHAYSAARPK